MDVNYALPRNGREYSSYTKVKQYIFQGSYILYDRFRNQLLQSFAVIFITRPGRIISPESDLNQHQIKIRDFVFWQILLGVGI